MSYDGFFCFQGVTFAQCQVERYLQDLAPDGMGLTGNCGICCDDLADGLGTPGLWNAPLGDDAPWVDLTQPASLQFAGLFVEKITGLGPGAWSRNVIQRAGGGTVLGASTQTGPVVVVTGLLLGKTCEAMAYGLAWLRTALRGTCAGSNCSGEDFQYLTAIPCADQDCLNSVETPALYKPFFRTIKGAALIQGPDVVETIARGCPACSDCGIQRVQFTIAGSQPCVFGERTDLFSPVTIKNVGTESDCDITWSTDDDCVNTSDDCADSIPCSTDPLCPPVPTPPSIPIPSAPCSSDCDPIHFYQFDRTIPAGAMVTAGDAVPYFEVMSGNMPLRNLRVRIHQNPLSLKASELRECDACSEFSLAYMPAQSTFTLDAAAHSKTITCPGQGTTDAPLTSTTGTRFLWPEFACPDVPLTIVVTAAFPIADDATFAMGYFARDC